MAIIAQQAIDEFGPALARVAACYERDRARRDELLEEIFLAIASSVPRLTEYSRRKTFLFRVAHNRATSFVQRLPSAPGPSGAGERETPQLEAIRGLIMPYRQTITLLLEDFCESEIAEVLGLPLGRVRLHIERGKQQLAVRLDELREGWHHQHAGVSTPPARWWLRSQWPHILLAVQLALAVAGALTGMWLAYVAWRLASLPSGAGAVVLLLTAPLLAVVAFLARKENLRWERESPVSVLGSGRIRAEVSLMAIRLGRGYVCVIGSHIAILWVSELGGLISAREFLIFYSSAWAVTAVSYLPWLARRERLVYEERAITSRLLGEVSSADD